jgi:hypothetical protein
MVSQWSSGPHSQSSLPSAAFPSVPTRRPASLTRPNLFPLGRPPSCYSKCSKTWNSGHERLQWSWWGAWWIYTHGLPPIRGLYPVKVPVELDVPTEVQALWAPAPQSLADPDITLVYGDDTTPDSEGEDIDQEPPGAPVEAPSQEDAASSSSAAAPARRSDGDFLYDIDQAVVQSIATGKVHEWFAIELRSGRHSLGGREGMVQGTSPPATCSE